MAKVNLKVEVTCQKCKRVRITTESTIRHWIRKHPDLTLADYSKNNMCRPCSQHTRIIISPHKEYDCACPRCGRVRKILGSTIKHSINTTNRTIADIINEYSKNRQCKYCCYPPHLITHPDLTGLKIVTCTCTKCGKTRNITPKRIKQWCYLNKGKTPQDYQKQWKCRACERENPYHQNVNNSGYIMLTIPSSDPNYSMTLGTVHNKPHKHAVPFHRYVMAQILGRPLETSEQVHHRDGNRMNNDPSNLELRKLHHGNGASITPNAEELLSRLEKLWEENKTLKELVNAK